MIRPPKVRGAARAEDELTHKLARFLEARKPNVIPHVLRLFESSALKAEHAGELEGLSPEEIKKLTDRVLDDLKLEGWSVARPDLEKSILAVGEEAGARALAQVGAGTDENLLATNERALDWARKRSAELVGKRWNGTEFVDTNNPEFAIDENTREMLRGDVSKAFKDGLNREQLRSLLEDSYAFSERRARLIAQTELNFAQSNGIMAGWDESGVVHGKGSLLSADHPKPDECDDNAAQGVIPVGEPFDSGDDAPPYHPGCFCVLYGEVDEEQEVFEEAA